ncbi:MAG: lysophospholipid acyltransferase family protein [Bacteroidales bacterium]|nr:lysophospholipid acyltransferase family protein [Bacteroidales bacterium]MCF8404576.1 lysophospholipid acyltransferase family protein [Bacteroidales bacterium]
MNLILAGIAIFFIFLVGIIPFFLLYLLSDIIRFILFFILRYRRKIVEKNLKESFHYRTEGEVEQLTWLFYKNLADVLLEGFKAFTMSRNQINKRHKVLNPELVVPYFEKGQSIIAVPSHYGNWEWGSMSSGLQMPQNSVVFYKPLNNKWVDRFVRRSRAKYGSELVSIYKTARVFKEHVPKNSCFIMASDQSPSNVKKAIWVKFLSRDTAFLHGPEYYAREYNLPVIFVDIQRKKRGYYELELAVIAENPAELEEGEITQRYAKKLEKTIVNKPENWLWSHRRWKHERK